MKTRDIRDLVRFSDDGPTTQVLWEAPGLWSEIVCLEGSQDLGPVVDERSDGLLIVLAGEVAVQVGLKRARMKQWSSVLVPAGRALTIRNASPEPSVILIALGPPPAPSA
jgi:mannose-6-phosphate isomerase-like protein (cupin superfamily)